MRPAMTVNVRAYKRIALFYFVSSLILCYLFSYQLSEGFVVDLRIVPFLIGGLYMRLSPIMGLLIITIRGFHGIDTGFFLGVGFYGVFSYFIWSISPWFLKLTSKYRILFSVMMTLIVSILILIFIELDGLPLRKLDVWFAYIVVPPLGVAMISSLIEMFDKNILLHKQSVKMEKLAAVEQMGAAISHEIRNPLTAAIGFVQLLEEGTLKTEKKEQYLTIIEQELESAERVIKDYLTFSKPIIESIVKLNINDELTHLIKLLLPLANLHSVKISTNFSAVGFIEGDRQKFHQCFINAIKNGIESMPDGGDLLIETTSTKTKLIIKIHDTGLGMSKDQLNRLGEPYYFTKGAKGTGLNLMVTYSIVRAMNGTIDVQSEIGKGTVFHYSFNLYTPIL